MRKSLLSFVAAFTFLSGLPILSADEVRYYKKDGVTYQETRRTVRQPVSETYMQERRSTVYQEQVTTEMRESYRTTYAPITEYHWEARNHGWWNPFAPPHIAYHLVPRTRWEPRSETLRIPVTTRQWVPQERIVRTPVTTLRFKDAEQITRVAVSPTHSLSGSNTSLARQNGLGGVDKMESDPPRRGTVRR